MKFDGLCKFIPALFMGNMVGLLLGVTFLNGADPIVDIAVLLVIGLIIFITILFGILFLKEAVND